MGSYPLGELIEAVGDLPAPLGFSGDQAMSRKYCFGLKVVDFVPATPVADNRHWLAQGPDWRVWQSGSTLMLEYQSGEHCGGLRSIAIESDDFAALEAGRLTCDEVLRRHHAS